MFVPRSGKYEGRPEDPERCVAAVPNSTRAPRFFQCLRRRGHGPDGKFCKQHAKLYEQEQEQKREWEAWKAKQDA